MTERLTPPTSRRAKAFLRRRIYTSPPSARLLFGIRARSLRQDQKWLVELAEGAWLEVHSIHLVSCLPDAVHETERAA